MFGGFTDMLFQLFLFSSVSGSGLSSSVPLQVGAATLFGAFLTLLIDKRANLYFFIPGVFISIIAVIMDTVTYGSLQKDNKEYKEKNKLIQDIDQEKLVESTETEPQITQKFSMKKIAIVGLCGAAVGIPFGPSMALAGQEPHSLSPYVLLQFVIDL